MKTLDIQSRYGNTTVVMRNLGEYFLTRARWDGSVWSKGLRRYFHSDFDERLHPHHFDIARWWRNLCEQDAIAARLGLPGEGPYGWGWGDPP